MKTLLITGINGFLGSHLAHRLIRNYALTGLESLQSSLDKIRDLAEDVQIYRYGQDDLEKLFSDHHVYGIIHTATVYGRNQTDIPKLLSSNLMMPIELISQAIKHGTRCFLNTDTFINMPESQLQYLNEYTRSKKHFLEWLHVFESSIQIINLKLHHQYGPGDALSKFIPSMIAELQQNTPDINLTPGKQRRDFIYVDDVVCAYETVLKQIDQIPSALTEMEVGTGTTTSIRTLVETMHQITGSKSRLHFGALSYREGEFMNSQANIKPLAELGWKPQVTLEQGIRYTIEK